VGSIKLGRKDILEDNILSAAMDSEHNGLRTKSIIESGARKKQHDESVCKISIGLKYEEMFKLKAQHTAVYYCGIRNSKMQSKCCFKHIYYEHREETYFVQGQPMQIN